MALENAVNEVADELVPKDVSSWCKSFTGKEKVVHDAVWGTIRLQPHEVAIIDTPLFQRLRRIHQTGAAHLVYPSARHTRFEHSIGVLHQASRMCQALIENGQGGRVSDEVRATARVAALLHDTGHGPFSHTSEQFFGGHPSFEEFKHSSGNFQQSHQGELLSCLLTVSPPVQKLISEINAVFGTNLDTATIAGYISGSLKRKDRFQSEIIHGPFDADKLDYMFRDGHFSGLEIPVDLDRLYYSISVETSTDREVVRLCGSSNATNPLMQIAFNKMLLFAGMYHHHKVRAVDCMLWSIFELAEARQCRVGGVTLRGPADYLRLTDDELLIPELCDDEEVRGLVQEVRNRRLWKRALVISKATIPPDDEEDSSNGVGYHRLVSLSENDTANFHEKRRVASEIARVANVSPSSVWLDVPKAPSAGEAQEMWIKMPGEVEPQNLGMVMPIKEWVEIYANTRYTAHVFCKPGDRQDVNRAAKEVLHSEFGLSFKDSATDYAKLD